jgi:F-type H+-transporting ATPase subunit delta
MSTRTSATRYARALLDVALQEADLPSVERGLAGFADAMASNRELEQALTNPSVPSQVRQGIVAALVARMAPPAPAGKLLALLAERDRLALLPQVLEVYRELVLEHQQIVKANVRSATALGMADVAALQVRLSEATGRQVQVEATVDPSLIGGLVAEIGSTVYDGSVRTQLQKMRQQLVEQG